MGNCFVWLKIYYMRRQDYEREKETNFSNLLWKQHQGGAYEIHRHKNENACGLPDCCGVNILGQLWESQGGTGDAGYC